MRSAGEDLAMESGHLFFPGTRAGFERGFADLRHALDRHSLQPRVRYYCELVFEEVVTNIIKYGYLDDRERSVGVWLDFPGGDAIVLTFEDDGVPFNPLDAPHVAPIQPQPNAGIGGRGLLLIRTAARRLAYERTSDDRNRLTVTLGPH